MSNGSVTKADLELQIEVLKGRVVELENEIRGRDQYVQQAEAAVQQSQEAYEEATGMVGDLLVGNRLLQRRLQQMAQGQQTEVPETADGTGPGLSPAEAQELGLA